MALVWDYANAPLIVLAIVGVLRWGIKVDRGLTRTTTVLEQMEKRLNGHDQRIGDLERGS